MGIFVVSCNKEEEKEIATGKTKRTEIRSSVNPTVIDGTLKFESIEDLFQYADELLLLIKDDLDTSNVVNASLETINNDTLNKIQVVVGALKEQFDYTPLYDVSSKDEIGLVVDQYLPGTEFYLIFNSHNEVIIGDEIYVQKHAYEYYMIDKNDNTNRYILRNLDVNELLSIDDYELGIDVFSFDVIVRPRTKECDCSYKLKPTGSFTLTTNEFVLEFSCDHNFIGSSWYIEAYDESNNSYINTFNGTISSLEGNKIYFNIPKSVKKLKLKFCIVMDCGDGLKTECFYPRIDISDICCKKKIDITENHIIPATDIKMVNKVNNGIFFTYYYHLSEIQGRKNSNGKYIRSKLQQWLEVKARNVLCEDFKTDTDYDHCNNCRWNSERIYIDAAQPDTKYGFHLLGDCIFKNTLTSTPHLGVHIITPNYCN